MEETHAKERAAFDALAGNDKLSALVGIAKTIVGGAAEARRTEVANAERVRELAAEAKLEEDAAVTPFGNALTVLSRGPEDQSERALACALYAHVLAETKLSSAAEEDRAASDLLWLAANTPFDATSLVDRALGDGASEFLVAVHGRAERALSRPQDGLAETLCAITTLLCSKQERAATLLEKLRAQCTHPGVRALLTPAERPTETARLEGELVASPRGPVVTTLLALTGVLFVMQAARAFAKVALAYKRPAEATLSGGVIRITTKTQLLGRTLREREYVLTQRTLKRAMREVRYPRLSFYTGLVALSLGSFMGVSLFVDGARSASPSLLGVGLLVVLAGIAIEYALVTLWPGKRKRCRVNFEPARGPGVCIGDVDIARADQALALLKG
jgi:hypothetical protein